MHNDNCCPTFVLAKTPTHLMAQLVAFFYHFANTIINNYIWWQKMHSTKKRRKKSVIVCEKPFKCFETDCMKKLDVTKK